MRKLILISLLLVSVSQLFAQSIWTDKTRILPDKLRSITTGMRIEHSPSPNYAELSSLLDSVNGKYVWKHSTQVTALFQDLVIVSAGSYIWYSEKGWMENIQYSQEDFALNFSCKNGKLEKSKIYTFQKNYRFGNNLYGGDAMWFVIAKDKEGKLFKGIGILETEGALKPNEIKQ